MVDPPDEQAAAKTTVADPYARSATSFVEPPAGLRPTLRHLGPGMILVGSVVGSGELIMTTKLGAEAGFTLLWLVLFSCLIKVVVQAELARHTISSGKTFLEVFNGLPGPSSRRPPWMNLSWMAIVVFTSLAGLALYANAGKLVGGIGFSENIGVLTLVGVVCVCVFSAVGLNFWQKNARETGSASGERPVVNWFIWLWLATVLLMFINGGAILGAAGQAMELAFPKALGEGGSKIWAVLVAMTAAGILLSGSYQTLERFSVALVATFTVITIICTALLQWTGYAITPADIQRGLSFDLPMSLTAAVIMTALGMYAGTGIGTGEMMSYTYWCVEKGYARNAGERLPGEDWPRRARGWIRVMYADVGLTMVVYTVSTICFFFLGAAILHEKGLNPKGPETLSILQGIYTGTLGNWAATLFVVGAFFVLFSTVVSGAAGATRAMADGLCVMGIIDARDYSARLRFIRIFVVVSLFLHSATYFLFENPPLMLMISSLVAVALYPVMGLGALYLRYRGVDSRILPGKTATSALWVCGIAVALVSPLLALFSLAVKQGWITI